jgi:hypothetical protein
MRRSCVPYLESKESGPLWPEGSSTRSCPCRQLIAVNWKCQGRVAGEVYICPAGEKLATSGRGTMHGERDEG